MLRFYTSIAAPPVSISSILLILNSFTVVFHLHIQWQAKTTEVFLWLGENVHFVASMSQIT
jgi:hypothetical protein